MTVPRTARIGASVLMLASAVAVIGVVTPAATAQGGAPGAPPTPVEAVRPRVDTVSDAINAVGTLRAAESVVLKPEMAGRIEKIHFEEGQRVAAGAPLFSLDSSLARAEVNEWEATVAQSRRESSRATDLVQRKLAAQSDLDTKRSVLEVNEARLSSAKTRLDKTTIRAPFAGIVGLRQVSPGEYVNIGDPLASLTQVDPMKLDFRVPEVYLGKIAVGQPVRVQVDAFPGQEFAGRVYAIDPQLDPQGRAVMLRATLENDAAKLRPGLFARVALELGRRGDALLLPEQALWPQGDKQFVYVVRDGKAELVEVKLGTRRGGFVEIAQGLTPDALVVTAGQIKIGPGMPVQPIAAAATPPAATPAPPPKKD